MAEARSPSLRAKADQRQLHPVEQTRPHQVRPVAPPVKEPVWEPAQASVPASVQKSELEPALPPPSQLQVAWR